MNKKRLQTTVNQNDKDTDAVNERRPCMKITLDIPDGIICGFFNGVEYTNVGLQLVSYQLSSDDFVDGNTVELPRERKEGAD